MKDEQDSSRLSFLLPPSSFWKGNPMRNHRLGVLLLVPLMLLPIVTGPSRAGIFFNRKKKPTPNDRVPELLAQVKTDGDESKRAAAAQELRQYDPAQFPMIVPVLIDVLLTDPKPAVRAEAAQSLGKVRPVSQQGGMALEQALSNDSSMRVRLQARSALLQYHWSGYRSVRKDDLVPQTKEPPLAPSDPMQPTIAPATLPAEMGRLAPQPADGSRSTSGYRPAPPAPFPAVPRQPTMIEPPLAPPAAPSAPNPNPGGADNGPELTPP
jgi:hypothetical protein